MSDTSLLARQFAFRIIVPVLNRFGFGDGDIVVNLLLGTAAQETGFRAIDQIDGPALGFYQIEPATHDDIVANFVADRPALGKLLRDLAAPGLDPAAQLEGNFFYQTAIARLVYRRAPEPLPSAPDPRLLGAYYKAHFNTPEGAATVDQFVLNFSIHIGDPIHA